MRRTRKPEAAKSTSATTRSKRKPTRAKTNTRSVKDDGPQHVREPRDPCPEGTHNSPPRECLGIDVRPEFNGVQVTVHYVKSTPDEYNRWIGRLAEILEPMLRSKESAEPRERRD